MLTPIIYEGDKLITPQDKDMEKFGVKPFKKFDVFKQEYPFEIPEPIKPMREEESVTVKPPLSLTEGLRQESPEIKFVPKGLKSYSLEEIKPQQVPEVSLGAQDKNVEPQIIPKSFRPYNEMR